MTAVPAVPGTQSQSNMAARMLRRMGWGFVFVWLDLRIIFLDVLPDFIGYILIAVALQQLGRTHAAYARAKRMAIILIFTTLVNTIMPVGISLDEHTALPIGWHIYVQVLVGLHVILIYWIFAGMEYTAKQLGDKNLQQSIRTRRFFYLSLYSLFLFLYPFSLNTGTDLVIFLLLLTVLLVLMEFLFLRLPFRLSNSCKKRRPSIPDPNN